MLMKQEILLKNMKNFKTKAKKFEIWKLKKLNGIKEGFKIGSEHIKKKKKRSIK